ncbi:MAG TPA: glycosyltransferase family 39 protein, partial [Anaerolineae bacterium]
MSRWPWWFWLPVSAGIALRIAGLTASPLWYDESFSLSMTRLPLLDMVRTASLDFHPPLWEMIAWVSVRLFGINEFGLRLPSLLASIGALLLAADFAHRLLAPRAAAFGLTALAILPYQLWLAQDGRGYAVMSLLYLAAAWFALKGRWLGMGAALGLMMYVNLASPFYALTIGALCVGWWRRFEIRRYALGGVMAITAFVPWLSSYVHAANSKDFWTVPQTLGWFVTAIVRAMVVDSLPGDWWTAVAVLTVLGSIVAAIAITLAYRERGLVVMALLGALPFALMLLAVPVKNVILYRPLSALTAPLVLWLAASLIRLPGTFLKSFFATAWALIGIGGLLAWSAAAKGGELESL